MSELRFESRSNLNEILGGFLFCFLCILSGGAVPCVLKILVPPSGIEPGPGQL